MFNRSTIEVSNTAMMKIIKINTNNLKVPNQKVSATTKRAMHQKMEYHYQRAISVGNNYVQTTTL